MLTLRVRWAFPAHRPPIADAVVALEGERIVALGPAADFSHVDVDCGAAALLPGFVNAHAHLDLTDAAGRTPPTRDFAAWLRQIVAHRRNQTPADVAAAVASGVKQLLATGTTLVGDVSAQGASAPALAAAPIDAVVFRELIGLTETRADAALADARAWLASDPCADRVVRGLSPHAPYTVRASLARALFAEVSQEVPMAIHLGETPEENLLIAERRGPLVDFLQELGAWDPSGPIRDRREWLDVSRPVAWVHGNTLRADEVARGAVVYCPRTHAAFGHGPHPFRELLARGVPVALGTDSLASNPDLDVLAEARFVRRHVPDLASADLLRMLTSHGAAALGRSDQGDLAPGLLANLVVMPLAANPSELGDPLALVWDADTLPAFRCWRGTLVRECGHPSTA